MTKVTYICAALKKSSHLLYFIIIIFIFHRLCFNALFGRFATRGVQKHENQKSKNPSGLIIKKIGFFSLRPPPPPPPPPPSVVLFDFFYRVFGRFVIPTAPKKKAVTYPRHPPPPPPRCPLLSLGPFREPHGARGGAGLDWALGQASLV
jgi:hypothetical protein